MAALSGDARRALDICRRSTEIAEQRCADEGKPFLVGMGDVDAAVQEMYSSPKIVAMRCVGASAWRAGRCDVSVALVAVTSACSYMTAVLYVCPVSHPQNTLHLKQLQR